MEVLAKIGVDYRDRKMIWNLYMNQTASVMIDGELYDPAVEEVSDKEDCYQQYFTISMLGS